ncbi:MAG TPA: hypothetical protein VLB47_10015, partial [Solirubrobacteraceae bacterium]|nr:hypothetical protein [Solirubrobacteraceae bacterium]
MTTPTATSSTSEAPQAAAAVRNGSLLAWRGPAGGRALVADAVAGVDADVGTARVLLGREALRRRLLGLSDVLSAMLALVVVLSVIGEDHAALLALAGMPLLVIPFKIAGLYDRDELRLVQSTLDEAPLVMQLTGLFTLGITILQPLALNGYLGGGQLAALWAVTLAAILGGRVLARSVAGRVSPVERCLVIGEPERADRVCEKLAASRARARVVATFPLQHDAQGSERITPESVRALVHELQVHRIIIAPTTADTRDVVHLIRVAKTVGVRVSVLPRILEVVGSSVEFD